jgi:hypothetical protein
MNPTRLAVLLAAVAVAIIAVIAGLIALYWPAPGPPMAAVREPPVAAARDFLMAVARKDCDTAWTFFSADSQARIEHESEARTRSEPYYADLFAPRNLYCRSTYAHRYGQYDPDSVKLSSGGGSHAIVGVDLLVDAGFLMPGFFPTRKDVVPVEMEFVQEGGAWKIVIPYRETLKRRPRK